MSVVVDIALMLMCPSKVIVSVRLGHAGVTSVAE